MTKQILTHLMVMGCLSVLGITPVFAQANYHGDTQRLHIPAVELFSADGSRMGVFQAEMHQLPDVPTPTFVVEKLVKRNIVSINQGSILKRVRELGQLTCGVRANPQLGFAVLDENGHYEGFDIALCRAVAAAVLDDPEAIEFVPLSAGERGEALQSGRIDMLSRQATWTTTRDAQWGEFTLVMFYDGQGFMVQTDSEITQLEQLDGETVCVISGTTTESNLKDIFAQRSLTYTPVKFAQAQEAFDAYEGGNCTAITSDKSQLSALRNGFIDPDVHTLLEITVSKEPLTPVVPHGDSQWTDLVRTVLSGLINAEELGITQANVDTMLLSTSPAVKRFIGATDTFGQTTLGLKADALVQAIRAVGNYGEIYDRYLGKDGIDIPRGLNRLWTEGGLIYAPPLR